jgi:putative transposase
MARRYRSVFPGHPHHVIQRGNRRQRVFFSDDDRHFYLAALRKLCDKYGVKILAYCLMENHVHLVLLPSTWDSLANAVGETHKTYTRRINKREKWRGYLWQGRFSSFILHEVYFWTVLRYVELNPVRAGVVGRAEDYRWSSALAHIGKKKDPVLDEVELLPDWQVILRHDLSADELAKIRLRSSSGKPLGDERFMEIVSKELGIDWKPKKRGPKRKE